MWPFTSHQANPSCLTPLSLFPISSSAGCCSRRRRTEGGVASWLCAACAIAGDPLPSSPIHPLRQLLLEKQEGVAAWLRAEKEKDLAALRLPPLRRLLLKKKKDSAALLLRAEISISQIHLQISVHTKEKEKDPPTPPDLRAPATVLQLVGLIAVNDGIILRNHVSRILKKHFRAKPYYVDLINLFN